MSTHAVVRDDDYVIDQNWAGYSADEHAVWDFLYRRQRDILADRADDRVDHKPEPDGHDKGNKEALRPLFRCVVRPAGRNCVC